MPLSAETVGLIQDAARRYPSAQSAILPALWAVQDEEGYVTAEAMREVAGHLDLPTSLVEATASFYAMYRTRPEGRHQVLICVNVSCALRGADDVVAAREQKLGVRVGETTPDGAITLRSTIECLGGCGGAPVMQADHRFEENLTPARLDAVFARLRGEPAPAAPPREPAAARPRGRKAKH